MEIPERWGVLAGIPSVVGVWIFSGTTHFDKICPCPTSRSHLFLQLFDKMYRVCNGDQSKDNRFFVFLNCWTSSRSQKTNSHLFTVTSDTQVMKSTNCYKICPLVRIGPNLKNNDIRFKD